MKAVRNPPQTNPDILAGVAAYLLSQYRKTVRHQSGLRWRIFWPERMGFLPRWNLSSSNQHRCGFPQSIRNVGGVQSRPAHADNTESPLMRRVSGVRTWRDPAATLCRTDCHRRDAEIDADARQSQRQGAVAFASTHEFANDKVQLDVGRDAVRIEARRIHRVGCERIQSGQSNRSQVLFHTVASHLMSKRRYMNIPRGTACSRN